MNVVKGFLVYLMLSLEWGRMSLMTIKDAVEKRL